MADKQINELPDGGPVVSTDSFPSQTVGNVTERHTAAQLKTFINAGTFILGVNTAEDIETASPILGESNLEAVLNLLAVGMMPAAAIPTTVINAEDLDTTIATTILEGKRIKYMYADLVGIVSSDGATAIHIGIEGDQEDLIIIEADESGLFTDGITNPYVTSLKTTAANRNISVKAIGGTFSAGTIEIYGEVTL